MMKQLVSRIFILTVFVGSVAQAQLTSTTTAPQTSWVKGATTRGLQVSAVTAGASTATIGYAHFVDAATSYRFDAGLNFTKPAGEGSSTQFSLSVDFGYRTYVVQAGSVKAFTQPGIFLSKASTPADFGDELTIAVQYLIGAEYFINPNFSLGASSGVALTFSQGFDQITLGTGTSALFAALYW